jgi:hypothetical protein
MSFWSNHLDDKGGLPDETRTEASSTLAATGAGVGAVDETIALLPNDRRLLGRSRRQDLRLVGAT